MTKKQKGLVKKTRNILNRKGLIKALGLAYSSLISAIKRRPRIKFAAKVLVLLFIALFASTKAISYIQPREANVVINGQAILVAENKTQAPAQKTQEISQNISIVVSPFSMAKPIDGPVSQGYTRYHRALDITSPVGTGIKPVGPGIVEFAGFRADGRGNVVIVDHGNGLKTLYAHMGKINVGIGNNVTPSVVLGTIGMTGKTTGPHVHFEVYDKGAQVNPTNLLP